MKNIIKSIIVVLSFVTTTVAQNKKQEGIFAEIKTAKGKIIYPGRNVQLLWDGPNMKITNFDEANQFVKRTYREGWSLGV